MALREANAARWKNMKILSSRQASLEHTAKLIISNKSKYQKVEHGLVEQGLYAPWWFVGIVHIREADGNFNAQLSQGDPLSHVSVHVPAGRGPFVDHPGEKYDAFTRGCFDALVDCAPHSAKSKDWSVGGTLTQFELYNGLGYANKGIPSPYVWSGTDQYTSGKYVADGVFSASTVDTQPGCAALLYLMMQLDSTIKFGGLMTDTTEPTPVTPVATPSPVSSVETGIEKFFKGLWTKDFTNMTSGTMVSAGALVAILPQISAWLGTPLAQSLEASLGVTPYVGVVTAILGAITFIAKGRPA